MYDDIFVKPACLEQQIVVHNDTSVYVPASVHECVCLELGGSLLLYRSNGSPNSKWNSK